MVFARKIAYNVAVSSVSKVFSTLLALISIGFITRYLGKEGFGEYATVLAFLSFFSALADLGLYSISTREISREGADEERIIGNIFSLRVLTSLLVLVIGPLFIWLLPYPVEVKKGIAIILGSFLFSSSYQVLNGLFQKNLAMDKVAISELSGKVVQVAVVALAYKFNLGFDWIILSLLVNSLVSFSLVYLWSKKFISLKPRFETKYWKEFLRESLPVGVAALITFVYFKMDTILLSFLKSSAEVGIYGAAYKVIENITFFPAMIIGLILPVMSQSIFSKNERFVEISNKTFKVFVVLVIPIVIATLFLADQIINIIGGEGFAESTGVLRVLIFALAFIFFGNFFNAIMIAGNLQKRMMIILGVAAVLNISLNLLLIPRFSYMAAAYVSVATEFLVVAMTFHAVAKKTKYKPKMEKVGRAFLSGVGMALALFFLQKTSIFISGPVSVAIYFLLLWAGKTITSEEIKSLISKQGIKKYENVP